MARSKRRSEEPVDEPLDDALDEGAIDEDALDEDALDDADDDDADDADDADDDDADDEPSSRRARSNGKAGTATKAKKPGPRRSAKGKEFDRPGVFTRIINFVREVVAELRKVIWPTRNELLTYTAVVVVFVTVMFTIVSGLDIGLGKAMLWIFGTGTTK